MQKIRRNTFVRCCGGANAVLIFAGFITIGILAVYSSQRFVIPENIKKTEKRDEGFLPVQPIIVANKVPSLTFARETFAPPIKYVKSIPTKHSKIIPSLDEMKLPPETYNLFQKNNFFEMPNEKISIKLNSREKVEKSPKGRVMSLLKPMDSFIVPNIVHYIWFGKNKKWKFYQMLSIMSTYKFVKPDYIYFHCDHEPIGEWWDYCKKHAKNMIIVPATAPTKIFNETLVRATHPSDIYRMTLLYNLGGIYFDTDVVGLKPFHDLRVYNLTLGLEYHPISKHVGEGWGRVNTGILISAKYPKFFEYWWNTYKNFSSKKENDYHACVLVYYLQLQYPELVHVEEKTLNYPSGPEHRLLYDKLYDYSNNYAMHLWYENIKGKYNPQNIKKLNTTFGRIARSIYYNTTDFVT